MSLGNARTDSVSAAIPNAAHEQWRTQVLSDLHRWKTLTLTENDWDMFESPFEFRSQTRTQNQGTRASRWSARGGSDHALRSRGDGRASADRGVGLEALSTPVDVSVALLEV
jgi:hypothetical protein